MVRLSGVRIARHHAACRTVDTKPRRGILADDPVSDRFGRRRWLRPLRGCGKGGAVEFLGEVPFVRTERWGIGGFRYHWLCSMFRTLSQPLPVPENGTFSLSRAQSRTCSGYAEARKRSEKIQLLTERSYVRTFVFTSRFPRSVYVAGNLYWNRSGVFVVGGGLSASGSTVDGVRRGTRFRSVVGIG